MTTLQAQWEQDLARSLSQEMEDFWTQAHKAAFKDYLTSYPELDTGKQIKERYDRFVELGHTILKVEEKADHTDYPNFAIEVTSSPNNQGWIGHDTTADILSYGFVNRGVVYYFPMEAFKHAWVSHAHEWKQAYGVRTVRNSQAKVCPVPVTTYLKHLPHRCITLTKESTP